MYQNTELEHPFSRIQLAVESDNSLSLWSADFLHLFIQMIQRSLLKHNGKDTRFISATLGIQFFWFLDWEVPYLNMYNKIIQAIYSNLILTQYSGFAIHEIHNLIFKKSMNLIISWNLISFSLELSWQQRNQGAVGRWDFRLLLQLFLCVAHREKIMWWLLYSKHCI